MKIHHIGYLVKNMEKSIIEFCSLGYTIQSKAVYDHIRDIFIVFLSKDEYRIELVMPASKDSVVYSLSKKYKNAPYHICYETEDFNNECNRLAENGYICFQQPECAPAIEGRRVAFFMHRYTGMIELLEGREKEDAF